MLQGKEKIKKILLLFVFFALISSLCACSGGGSGGSSGSGGRDDLFVLRVYAYSASPENELVSGANIPKNTAGPVFALIEDKNGYDFTGDSDATWTSSNINRIYFGTSDEHVLSVTENPAILSTGLKPAKSR